jgi:hypothetical protein
MIILRDIVENPKRECSETSPYWPDHYSLVRCRSWRRNRYGGLHVLYIRSFHAWLCIRQTPLEISKYWYSMLRPLKLLTLLSSGVLLSRSSTRSLLYMNESLRGPCFSHLRRIGKLLQDQLWYKLLAGSETSSDRDASLATRDL